MFFRRQHSLAWKHHLWCWEQAAWRGAGWGQRGAEHREVLCWGRLVHPSAPWAWGLVEPSCAPVPLPGHSTNCPARATHRLGCVSCWAFVYQVIFSLSAWLSCCVTEQQLETDFNSAGVKTVRSVSFRGCDVASNLSAISSKLPNFNEPYLKVEGLFWVKIWLKLLVEASQVPVKLQNILTMCQPARTAAWSSLRG